VDIKPGDQVLTIPTTESELERLRTNMLAAIIFTMGVITPMDQTVNVTKGTKLDVSNFAGDVSVKTWDRDAVRVQVTISDRETVDIKPGDQVLTIRSRSVRGGRPRSLDYAITMPKWMAINVNGTYVDANLDGVGADVTVETTNGDIKVVGGSGFVSLKSVQGEITLEKAKGRIEVRAVNEGIHLADVSGDLSAESTNGSIILDRIDSANVDLYSVNGNISYDGPIKDKGLYRLTTHNGLIAVGVPERVNAVLRVRTYNGSFRSTFPVKTDDENQRKRFTVTLGNGSAHMELESFGGTIALRRPGEPRPETERRRQRERDKDKGAHFHLDHDIESIIPTIDVQPEIDVAVAEAMRDAQPEIERAIEESMRELEHMQPEIEQAIEESMRELEHAFPMPRPMPHIQMPQIRPWPQVNPWPHVQPRIW
jgi:putative adhesin